MSDTAPRTLREASQRPANTSWLNAKSHTPIGTRSCTWNQDDLFYASCAKGFFIASAIGLAVGYFLG